VLETPVRTMHLCEVATLRQRFDVVLMLMKAYDSRWAAQLIEPYLAEDGLLVGVQNGMTVDTIAEVVGLHRTLGCVIEISSTMEDPGIVRRHSGPDRSWFALGALDASTVDRTPSGPYFRGENQPAGRVGEVATLGGFLGFLSGRSNDFGSPSTRAWSLAPSISWAGLNVQRVRANLHASEARSGADADAFTERGDDFNLLFARENVHEAHPSG